MVSGLFGTLYSIEYLNEEPVDSVKIFADLALRFNDQNEDAL